MIFLTQNAPREILQYRLDGEKYEAEFVVMEESHAGEIRRVLNDAGHSVLDAEAKPLISVGATRPWAE